MTKQKRLTGLELGRRLSELAEDANRSHRAADGAWVSALRHANEAGKALEEAKKLTGGRGKWTKWLEKSYEGSKSSARVYMRIARHWDDPRIEQARTQGMRVDSISVMLELLKNNRTAKPKPPRLNHTLEEELIERHCQVVLAEFTKKVRSLGLPELDLLTTTGIGELWQKLCEELLAAGASSGQLRDKASILSGFHGPDEIARGSRQRKKRNKRGSKQASAA